MNFEYEEIKIDLPVKCINELKELDIEVEEYEIYDNGEEFQLLTYIYNHCDNVDVEKQFNQFYTLHKDFCKTEKYVNLGEYLTNYFESLDDRNKSWLIEEIDLQIEEINKDDEDYLITPLY